ncbi:hypothetical protein [Aquimarina sp. AU474]|uniref:hypothetical protein n=1 Tax=Aquimarina sp. AU474 TaxID=2108529 RepID=UPI000D69EAC4|nr:hypothetical protein [Aquimarina sp. AU474]
MKHLLIIISLFLVFSSCEAQEKKRISEKKIKKEYYEYYSKPGLNAKVKHIEDLKYEGSEERQYDLHGNIIKKIYSSKTVIRYLYDNEQNLLREEIYNSEDKLITKKNYERNNKNKSLVTGQIQIRNKDTISNERNTYDKNGNLILSEFIKNSVWEKAFAYEYDEKGRKVLKHDYIIERYGGYPKALYKYDEFDNLIRTKELDSNNNLIRSATYKYDERKNKIEYILLSEPNKTVISKEFTTYDTFDNIKSISNNKNGENQQEYKYKYNEYGDWIEKTFYYSGYVDQYVKRKIEY